MRVLPFFLTSKATGMDEKLIKQVEYFRQFVTERRLQRIDKVLENRTRYITVVLEDVYQSHNISAVIRSCECLGIQDLHLIENLNPYRVNDDIALGSNKWISIYRYGKHENNTVRAIESLKAMDYRIVAASAADKGDDLYDFNLHAGKCAMLFGTEKEGLSEQAVQLADTFIHIPMSGMTESFNVSVSAGIILSHLVQRLRNSSLPWRLNDHEKAELRLQWIKNSIKNADAIERLYFNNQ